MIKPTTSKVFKSVLETACTNAVRNGRESINVKNLRDIAKHRLQYRGFKTVSAQRGLKEMSTLRGVINVSNGFFKSNGKLTTDSEKIVKNLIEKAKVFNDRIKTLIRV